MDSAVTVYIDAFIEVSVRCVHSPSSLSHLIFPFLIVSPRLLWPLIGLGFNPRVSLYTVSVIKNNEMFTPFAFSSMSTNN